MSEICHCERDFLRTERERLCAEVEWLKGEEKGLREALTGLLKVFGEKGYTNRSARVRRAVIAMAHEALKDHNDLSGGAT